MKKATGTEPVSSTPVATGGEGARFFCFNNQHCFVLVLEHSYGIVRHFTVFSVPNKVEFAVSKVNNKITHTSILAHLMRFVNFPEFQKSFGVPGKALRSDGLHTVKSFFLLAFLLCAI